MQFRIAWWILGAALAGGDVDGDGILAPLDCDDTDASVGPGLPEVLADGIDQDCDGVDACYADGDGDGFGAAPFEGPITGVPDTDLDCTNDSAATTDRPFDCDDSDPQVFVGAEEIVGDGIDQDCSGGERCYADEDGDGFGHASVVTIEGLDCDQHEGASTVDTDCDDDASETFPGASETCDGRDNSCDGVIDGGLSLDTRAFRDADGDGFGDPEEAMDVCALPVGFVVSSDDCDDRNANVSPIALERCDGIDNDCDGEIDVGGAAERLWFEDVDGDGFGDEDALFVGCEPPEGTWVPSGTLFDCAVDNASVGPCGGCGCRSGGAGGWAWVLLPLLWLRTSGRAP